MKTLTKEEIQIALKEGKKVRHRYFGDHEWMKLEGNQLVFEDGVKQPAREFWAHRDGGLAWNDDWSIVNEK